MNSEIDGSRDRASNTNHVVSDPDTARVIEILHGAYRGPRDPDIDLAMIIADLRGVSDDAIRSALAALVKNANQD